jgi:hypothetical protein
MIPALRTPSDVRALIEQGRPLLLAGEERLLAALPPGNWIGGTTPYFVTSEGAVSSRDHIFVTQLPAAVTGVTIATYGANTIRSVYADAADDALAFVILPADSRTHLEFALHAPRFPSFAVRPLVGWVAGVHLSEVGSRSAKVFDGRTAAVIGDGAVVMRIRLAPGLVADTGIVNVFDQGDGPDLEFEADGYSATHATIGGELRPLAAWMKEQRVDPSFPLVADYLGARVNVSVLSVDEASGEVRFYAPVFAGVKYRLARPVPAVAEELVRRLPDLAADQVLFSCDCILNYTALQGHRTGVFLGPVTYGEVAYQLLNQTLVYVTLERAEG